MFVQFINCLVTTIYENIIPIIVIVVFSQIIILILIRSDDRYYCHIDGCNEAFDTFDELIVHLITVHDYSYDSKTDKLKTRKGEK
jgi:hypothetical protein